jgi:hypothetical protein
VKKDTDRRQRTMQNTGMYDCKYEIHIILIFAAAYLTKLAMDRLVITSVRAAHMNTPAAVSHDISKENQMCN